MSAAPPATVAVPHAVPAALDDAAVVHVDAACVVLDKPAGLLSVPGRGPDKADCLVARARLRWPDALTVHRLDMATSGLIVLGRGAAAQRALSIAFEQRRVDKRYVAVVAGLPAADAGEIDAPLVCDWPNRPRQMVCRDRGRPAMTRWRILARDAAAGRSRVEVEPVTGRSHQLRVHLATLGHPIVGDDLYAPLGIAAAAPRLLLHAAALAFPHPETGERVAFERAPSF